MKARITMSYCYEKIILFIIALIVKVSIVLHSNCNQIPLFFFTGMLVVALAGFFK